jgi:hypothetical protein
MASLLAACRQNPAAARRFHARAEAVRLCAASPAWLKCALWQNNPPISARPQSDPFMVAIAKRTSSSAAANRGFCASPVFRGV